MYKNLFVPRQDARSFGLKGMITLSTHCPLTPFMWSHMITALAYPLTFVLADTQGVFKFSSHVSCFVFFPLGDVNLSSITYGFFVPEFLAEPYTSVYLATMLSGSGFGEVITQVIHFTFKFLSCRF